ncbi:hypothetical protein KIN20_017264 [Parelaphostrongylus tenuis]|uniref:Uncharacterized protein n=1 Tax=Parelaphostrongylus tenuis TaxID=148309 RepID=A0AAD5MMZ9_PARTN|nr:hypothetical protein KIN20_017264 [Parelaphostrongylus tenuis]
MVEKFITKMVLAQSSPELIWPSISPGHKNDMRLVQEKDFLKNKWELSSSNIWQLHRKSIPPALINILDNIWRAKTGKVLRPSLVKNSAIAIQYSRIANISHYTNTPYHFDTGADELESMRDLLDHNEASASTDNANDFSGIPHFKRAN